MALMGATGVTELFMRSGRYRPYGSRCGAGNPLQGKAAFRWAGKVSDTSAAARSIAFYRLYALTVLGRDSAQMVYWNMYWYLNSDGEPDFTGGEGGLEF